MKNKVFIVVILANLAAALLLVFAFPELMVAPGRLTDVHQKLSTDCFACHSAFTGSSPAKCVECHKVEEIGLVTTKGVPIGKEKKHVAFHQKLVEADCVACHSEHKGVQPYRPIGRFSHELLEASTRQQCGDCHLSPRDGLHQRVKAGCAQCHTLERWRPATFDHDQYFRFDRHHPEDCETCHRGGDYSNYTCYGCHEHSRSKMRAEHYEEGIMDYENCAQCHRSGDEDEAKYLWRSGTLMRGSRGELNFSRRESRRGGGHDDD